MNEKKFYITTAIDYVNGAPHLGHAFEKVQADVIARYHRLQGRDVFFLTGTDEHGATNVRGAKKASQPVHEFTEGMAAKFRALKAAFNLSWDDFIRTSDKARHWPGVKLMWEKLAAKGDIYKKNYKGLYCVGHEAFITQKELADGKCAEHLTEPEVIEEENHFFRLSKYSKEIGDKIRSGELAIIPESRKNEILSLIDREGLEDVSFSRPRKNLQWGIPAPGDDSETIYVWCDALTSYLSAIGFGSTRNIDISKLRRLWPADVQVIGKSILRFHAAIWPGMLLSAGLPLPKTLFVHGFINVLGQKMSKTIGNVIDPFELVKKYGTDAVRFYLLHDVSTFGDTDFTEERFKESYNAHLANGLGNLVSRVMKMAVMSNTRLRLDSEGEQELLRVNSIEFNDYMNKFELQRTLEAIWRHIKKCDGYIEQKQPFKVIQKDPERATAYIEKLLKDIFISASLLRPFMPETSEKILNAIKDNAEIKTQLFPRIF